MSSPPCSNGINGSKVSSRYCSPLHRQPAQKRAARSREGIKLGKALPDLPKATSSNVADETQSLLTKDRATAEFVAATGRVMGVLNPPTRVGPQYRSRSRSRERLVTPKSAKKARRDTCEPESHDRFFTTRNSTSPADRYCNGYDSRSPLEGKDDVTRVKKKRTDFQGNKNQLPAKVMKQRTSPPKNLHDTSQDVLNERQKQSRQNIQEWLFEQSTGDYSVLGLGHDPLGSRSSDNGNLPHDRSRNKHLPDDCLSWANPFDNRIQTSSTRLVSSDTINTVRAGSRGTTGEDQYDAARSKNDEKNHTSFRKVRRKPIKRRQISRSLSPSAAISSPGFLEKRPSLPYPSFSTAHAREEIPKVPIMSSENRILHSGYQYIPTDDYRQDSQGFADLSDGIVPTPPPHLEPVELRRPQESKVHTTADMKASQSAADEVLVAQKEHANFMAYQNVPKESRQSIEEGDTEKRMEKDEFSDAPYSIRDRLKRRRWRIFKDLIIPTTAAMTLGSM
ncbi:hypothetical protein N431DRAFT_474897 [Stipitochalara longipes BDJ]|nr:hypothetical protein N431DRAFT_474897 [Stipitochalara longipes BDJ]